jgi:endonuclease/exonuclease/phosphatase (EEP) superfamily protein YafD
VRRLLAVSIVLLSAAVAGGLLDGIVWPGPPLALFRPQLTLFLVPLILLALALGPRWSAAVGLAAVGLGIALLVPAIRDPEPEPPPAGRSTVKVLALNLWRQNDDVEAVTELIREERPDVVALTELTPAWARALAPVLQRYPISASRPDERSSGIGLYARAYVSAPRVRRLVDGGRPVAEARLKLGERAASLLVAHPTAALLPGDRRAHERELTAIGDWARRRGPLVAVCGDLNAAPWTRTLRDVLTNGDLRAALPGDLVAGSWPALVPPLRVAVDGCLVGAGIRARAELGPRVGSDHLPVLIELA